MTTSPTRLFCRSRPFRDEGCSDAKTIRSEGAASTVPPRSHYAKSHMTNHHQPDALTFDGLVFAIGQAHAVLALSLIHI